MDCCLLVCVFLLTVELTGFFLQSMYLLPSLNVQPFLILHWLDVIFFFIIISNNALFWNNITTKTPGPSRLLLYGQHLKNIATCYFLSIKCGRKTNQWFVHKVFFSQTGVRKIILIKCHTALVVKKTFPMNIQPQILLKVYFWAAIYTVMHMSNYRWWYIYCHLKNNT